MCCSLTVQPHQSESDFDRKIAAKWHGLAFFGAIVHLQQINLLIGVGPITLGKKSP